MRRREVGEPEKKKFQTVEKKVTSERFISTKKGERL